MTLKKLDPNGNVVRGESAFGESWQCPGDKNLVRCAAEKNCKPLKKRIPVSNCLIPDVNFWEDTPGVAPAGIIFDFEKYG